MASPDRRPPGTRHTGAVVAAVTLTGRAVRLEPLAMHHVDALVAAASESRAPYAYAMVPDGRDAMEAYVAAALRERQAGRQLPFATVLLGPAASDAGPAGVDDVAGRSGDRRRGEGSATPGAGRRVVGRDGGRAGRVVGSTRFDDIAAWTWPAGHTHERSGVPDAVEIGGTWLASSARRTVVNTEAKYLMLVHAFEVWRVHRVRLRTDVRNEVSRRAIERIGARFEGVLRADRPGADGTVRDSALFSVVAAEWPGVRAQLEERLAVPASGPA